MATDGTVIEERVGGVDGDLEDVVLHVDTQTKL
jgi:hypothetical protein